MVPRIPSSQNLSDISEILNLSGTAHLLLSPPLSGTTDPLPSYVSGTTDPLPFFPVLRTPTLLNRSGIADPSFNLRGTTNSILSEPFGYHGPRPKNSLTYFD